MVITYKVLILVLKLNSKPTLKSLFLTFIWHIKNKYDNRHYNNSYP